MKYPKIWFGIVAIGAMGWGALPTIAAAPPVVRAKGYAPQESICYMDSLGGGRQNLDATCLIGKPKTKAVRPFDMTTDRDKDGVPDDVDDFFARMEAAGQGGPNPAKIEQMAQLFKELADRSPLNADQKAALTDMGQVFRDLARSSTPNASPEQMIAQSTKTFERIGNLMRQVEKTPFMQQMNTYSNRRNANRIKQLEQLRDQSSPPPVPVQPGR
ncbi:MAG: hypothetical protein RLZZ511_1262 [Cyanobacteriota bacterium]